MRAIQRVEPGQARLTEVAAPQASEGEVLVDVLFAAVNPFDMQVLRGEIGPEPSRVVTLGAEATGLVDGRLVQVSGGGLGVGRDGTFAQAVVVPTSVVRPLPAGADPATAATVGVAGRTAWRAVHQLARVTPDDVVLVLGAGGGVGMFAAQLARLIGATVIAQTASGSKAARLRALGLDTAVAGSPVELRHAVEDRGVTVVLDPLGGDYLSALLAVLKPRARAVTYGVLAGRTTQIDLARLYGGGLQIVGTSGATTSPAESEEALAGALEALTSGDVVVDVEVVPLSAGPEVFDRLAQRSVTGKLLLQP